MIVYYSILNNSFTEELTPLAKCFSDDLDYPFEFKRSYFRCPAFQEYIKNMYAVRSTYDYELHYDKENKKLNSPMWNQEFFNNNVLPRNLSVGLFSYLDPKIAFFAEKDLEMELIPAHFHKTLKGHTIVPGTFNIGKHFRFVECAVHLFHSDIIKIKESDPLYYVKFRTNEKVEFKKFNYRKETFDPLSLYFEQKRKFTNRVLPLKWYYENSIRDKILKEIKKNLY